MTIYRIVNGHRVPTFVVPFAEVNRVLYWLRFADGKNTYVSEPQT